MDDSQSPYLSLPVGILTSHNKRQLSVEDGADQSVTQPPTKRRKKQKGSRVTDNTPRPGLEYVHNLVLSLLHNSQSSRSTLQQKLAEKIIMLDNPITTSSLRQVQSRRIFQERASARSPGKWISAASKRQLVDYDMLLSNIGNYQSLFPMHQIWIDYLIDLRKASETAIDNKKNAYTWQECLFKADWQGALIEVIQSTCPDYIGLKGILVLETVNIFHIVTDQNQHKRVPKAGSIFRLDMIHTAQRFPVDSSVVRSDQSVGETKSSCVCVVNGNHLVSRSTFLGRSDRHKAGKR